MMEISDGLFLKRIIIIDLIAITITGILLFPHFKWNGFNIALFSAAFVNCLWAGMNLACFGVRD